jgi:hypothetical protein
MNLLSLDVVLGAVAGMLFFSDLLNTSTPFEVYTLLGIAVWCIYSIDHLLDSRKIKVDKEVSARHSFHQKYFKSILLAVALFVFFGVLLLVFSESTKSLRMPGGTLAGVVVIWFFILHKTSLQSSWLKEVSTAFVYVAGISLAPIVLSGKENLDHFFWVFVTVYFFLALLNLLILSYLDEGEDKELGFGSVLTVLSRENLKFLIILIGLFLVVSGLGLLFFFPSYYSIYASVFMLIAAFHLLEFFRKGQKKETTRIKLEASFLLPFILLAF